MQQNLEDGHINFVSYVTEWLELFRKKSRIDALVNYLTTRDFNALMIGEPLLDGVKMKTLRNGLHPLYQRLSPASLEKVRQALSQLLKNTIHEWVAQSIDKAETVMTEQHIAEIRKLEEQIENLKANTGRIPSSKRTIFSAKRPTPSIP